MKRLYLTATKRVLNESAQKRLDEFNYDEPTDSEGRSADWYADMNLPIPKDLKQSEHIEFDPDTDYDEYEVDVIINLEDFTMAVDEEEYGSTIYLKSGHNIFVIQDTEDINAQIWYYNRGIIQKIKELVNKLKLTIKNGSRKFSK